MNPYIFNLVNGILLVFLGLWALSLSWVQAYFCITLGLVLIVLTYFVRSSNKIFGSLAMLSTILSTLLLGLIFYSLNGENETYDTAVGMMLISGFISSLAFIQCAVNHQEDGVNGLQTSEGLACCDKSVSTDENVKATGCC